MHDGSKNQESVLIAKAKARHNVRYYQIRASIDNPIDTPRCNDPVVLAI
jgi:hypothetical protein